MAIAFTALANMSTSTSNAESYNGTAGTPAAGDLLICGVHAAATVAAGTMTGTWTWNQLKRFTYNGGLDSMYVFWAYASAATSTTPTFACVGDAASCCEIYCLRVTGGMGGTAPCIRQLKTATATSTNAAVPMFGAILTGSGVLSFVAENGSSPAIFTAPSGWTTVVEAGTGTAPRHAFAESHRVSGEVGSTVTWGNGSVVWGAIAMEFHVLGAMQRQPGGGASSSPMSY